MKELSIEEKARRYDEAKLRMSAAYNSNRCTIGFMNEIFPELAESEDEMIRKVLVDYFKSYKEQEECGIKTFYGIQTDNIIAWIERQSEQKPADKVEPKFHEGDIITPKDRGHEPWQIMQVDILDKKYRFKDGYVIPFSHEDDYELVEQKPAWSEEDKELWDIAKQIFPESLNMQSGYVTGYIDAFKHFSLKKEWSKDDMKAIKEIIFLLKHYNSNETLTTVYSIEDMINWLESLKDRVQPQPKQEWSEKDAMQLDAAINIVANSGHTGTSDWLKSLRPQNRWKPSDEQLDMLAKLCSTLHLTSGENEIMESLYEQLEKLMEE